MKFSTVAERLSPPRRQGIDSEDWLSPRNTEA